jgi:hypothetical protein
MSNTSSIVTVAIGFLGTAGTSVATFLRQAKSYEATIQAYVVKVEDEVNTVLAEVQKISEAVNALTPVAPTPAPAKAKAPAKKAAAPRRRTTER